MKLSPNNALNAIVGRHNHRGIRQTTVKHLNLLDEMAVNVFKAAFYGEFNYGKHSNK